MKNKTKMMWSVLLLLVVMLIGFVSSSAQGDVKDYWIRKGLDESVASRIATGQQTQKDIALAEALDQEQEPIEVGLNQTIQQTEEFDWGGLFLIILFCAIPIIAVVIIITLYVRNVA